ncbi:winged helix-turn-helix transcriptional regulator [Pseudonocardia sp. GCM10023141]|uniref:winged helix-turn-helix transcriptional regulator n=1 Tax=Pseudonocardia sp. GCM10023141 TaxID=3252653 RepID=UPI003614AB23
MAPVPVHAAVAAAVPEPGRSPARAAAQACRWGGGLSAAPAFYGVRRFGDHATQLGIPRAVLTSRLRSLVQEGVLTRDHDAAGNPEYRLTAKGIALWPAVRTLMGWGTHGLGDEFYSPAGARRAAASRPGRRRSTRVGAASCAAPCSIRSRPRSTRPDGSSTPSCRRAPVPERAAHPGRALSPLRCDPGSAAFRGVGRRCTMTACSSTS